MKFYKYHGAGNDFLIADNRDGSIALEVEDIKRLCDRHTGFGSDGIMLLENSESRDFSMKFYNPDGSGGMMCGNGGRCIVAFAADRGYKSFDFDAPDGPHQAQIIKDGAERIIKLSLKDVADVASISENEYFLDTGTRHFVKFVNDLSDVDIVPEGRKIRYDSRFAPVGTNANFVQTADNKLVVRTYEKGVEDETLACGTGIVASAIAAFVHGVPYEAIGAGLCKYDIRARISSLSVSFRPAVNGKAFDNVWLTGPAEYIGEAIV